MDFKLNSLTINIVFYIDSLLCMHDIRITDHYGPKIIHGGGGDMDREAAIALARAYLAGGIEIIEIPEQEASRSPLYCSGDRHDSFFFYCRGPMEILGVGGSHYVAVSKKTGAVISMGMVGE